LRSSRTERRRQYRNLHGRGARPENTLTLLRQTAERQYVEGHKLRVIEAGGGRFAARRAAATWSKRPSAICTSANDSPSYLVTYLTANSALVDAAAINLAGDADFSRNFPAATDHPAGWLKLAGGDDALGGLTSDDFVGVDGGRRQPDRHPGHGKDITDVSIVIVPGMWASVIQSALITHCESLKSRFAIIDPPNGLDNRRYPDIPARPLDTKYAALLLPLGRGPRIRASRRMSQWRRPGHMGPGYMRRVDN